MSNKLCWTGGFSRKRWHFFRLKPPVHAGFFTIHYPLSSEKLIKGTSTIEARLTINGPLPVKAILPSYSGWWIVDNE
jgi:hypothetical protein